MISSRPIELKELLASRDERRNLQLRFLKEHPDQSLVVGTVIIPGAIKRSEDTLIIADAMVEALNKVTPPLHHLLSRDLLTGFEIYFLSDLAPDKLKQIVSKIEDNHPLGRLMDIDVIDKEGIPVSRISNGDSSRKCLLCDNDARTCMRAFTHSQEELLAEIHKRTSLWAESKYGFSNS